MPPKKVTRSSNINNPVTNLIKKDNINNPISIESKKSKKNPNKIDDCIKCNLAEWCNYKTTIPSILTIKPE